MTVATPGRQPDSGDTDEPRLLRRVGSDIDYNQAPSAGVEGSHIGSGSRLEPAETGEPGVEISDEVIDTLHRAFRRLRKSMIKPPQARVPIPSLGRPVDLSVLLACDALADLDADEQAISVKDLAAFLHLEHSTVSRLLGEIEADGLVQRSTDPADRRRTRLALTDLGYRVVDDYRRMQRFVSRTLMVDWTVSEMTELTRMLTKLAETAANLPVGLEDLIRDEFQTVSETLDLAPGEPAADQSDRKGRARWLACRAPKAD